MVIEEFKDVRAILGLVRRRSIYFLFPLIVIGVLGSVTVMSLPAIYSSQATILVESQRIPPDLVRSTITALASERLQIIQQRVLSRDNILSIVNKFHLFGDQPRLTKTDIVDLAKSRIEILPFSTALSGRAVHDDRLTIAFTISYEDENPETAARVANDLVTSVLGEDVKTRTSQAAEATSFLEKESARLRQELVSLEAQLAEYRLKNSEALPEKLPFNMSLNERLQQNIVDTEREIRSVDEEKRLVLFEASVRDAAGGGGGRSVGGRSELDTKIDALRAEISVKSAVYSPIHPEMRALLQALAELEKQRAGAAPSQQALETAVNVDSASLGRLDQSLAAEKIKTLEDRKKFLLEQKASYAHAAKQVSSIIEKTPEVGSILSGLERKRDSLQKSLDEVNDKFAQARLGEQLEQNQQSERFEVIEQPVVSERPTRPNRLKLLALVGLVAVGAGGALSFFVELTDSTLRSAESIQSRLGFRPLVVIPYIPLQREVRNKRLKLLALVIISLLLLFVAGLCVHLFYQPLDVLAPRLIDRIMSLRWKATG